MAAARAELPFPKAGFGDRLGAPTGEADRARPGRQRPGLSP